MKKVFGIAALLLALAACNKVETENTPVEQPSDSKGITITATLAPKTADTKAVTDNEDNKITVTWAENEHIAILYDKDGAQVADATITAVDGTTGAATISFTVVSGTADNTACTLVYPYSAAKDDHTGVKDAATLLAVQDGTLNANLDVRVGAGTIQTTTPSLTVTTQPEAQFAIWKLTLNNSAKDLYITADGVLIAGAIRSSAGTEFYVAVPVVDSKTVAAVATDGSSNSWFFSKDGVSLAAGKYYQSSPTMTALGTESSADVYKITGTSGATIPDGGKTVVLSGVNISSGSITCNGSVTMILLGSNSVTATNYNAAIKIGGSGTTLTITGSGSLTATGGFGGAGIGTERAQGASITCGDITINGGTVTATGGNSAAGIGTGLSVGNGASNTCGAITIGTGVTMVTATKGTGAPNSIGKGKAATKGTQTCGTITIGGTIYWDGSAYQNGGDTYLATSPLIYPVG